MKEKRSVLFLNLGIGPEMTIEIEIEIGRETERGLADREMIGIAEIEKEPVTGTAIMKEIATETETGKIETEMIEIGIVEKEIEKAVIETEREIEKAKGIVIETGTETAITETVIENGTEIGKETAITVTVIETETEREIIIESAKEREIIIETAIGNGIETEIDPEITSERGPEMNLIEKETELKEIKLMIEEHLRNPQPHLLLNRKNPELIKYC